MSTVSRWLGNKVQSGGIRKLTARTDKLEPAIIAGNLALTTVKTTLLDWTQIYFACSCGLRRSAFDPLLAHT